MSLPPSSKIIIVGGGIVGCATAYHIAKMGHEVLLLDALLNLRLHIDKWRVKHVLVLVVSWSALCGPHCFTESMLGWVELRECNTLGG